MPQSHSLVQVCTKRLVQKVPIVKQLMVAFALVAPISPTVADEPWLQV